MVWLHRGVESCDPNTTQGSVDGRVPQAPTTVGGRITASRATTCSVIRSCSVSSPSSASSAMPRATICGARERVTPAHTERSDRIAQSEVGLDPERPDVRKARAAQQLAGLSADARARRQRPLVSARRPRAARLRRPRDRARLRVEPRDLRVVATEDVCGLFAHHGALLASAYPRPAWVRTQHGRGRVRRSICPFEEAPTHPLARQRGEQMTVAAILRRRARAHRRAQELRPRRQWTPSGPRRDRRRPAGQRRCSSGWRGTRPSDGACGV